jgi:apolipoprotein N-acyltransferase
MLNDPILLQSSPVGGTVGLGLGVAFFVVFAAVAYVAFRLLRKTVKMAFRMAIVAAILLIAAVGAVSIYWFGYGTTTPTRQAPARSK